MTEPVDIEPPLRPMDSYDPSELGVPAATLAETVAAFDEAIHGLHRLREKLLGCMAPLNLYSVDKTVLSAIEELEERSGQLVEARQVIEGDTPLPAFFPDEAVAWSSREEGTVLSPAQLGFLAGVADKVPAEQLTTYRKELSALPEPAQPTLAVRLIRERQRAAENEERQAAWEQRRAARQELQARILADMESHPCESCGAEAGATCLTKSGGVATPHAPRKKASELAKEHPGEAKLVQRIDPDYRSRQIRPIRRQEPKPRQDDGSDPGMVREAISYIADSLKFEGRA